MTPQGSGPLLDVADLVARCGDDALLACELLALSAEARTQAMGRIAQALAAGDMDEVSMASHSLAGTFANIGLAGPAAMARALRVSATSVDEAAVRAGFAALAALAPAIDADVTAARAALEAAR